MKKVLLFVGIFNVLASYAQSPTKRVISISEKESDGTTMILTDTSSLQYFGNRAGNRLSPELENEPEGYDVAADYNFNAFGITGGSKEVLLYNSDDSITSLTYLALDVNNNWVDDDRYTYTYNSAKQLLVELFENSDGTNWSNVGRNTYTYDASGNRITNTYEVDYTNTWELDYRHTNTYDANNNLLSLTSERTLSSVVTNDFRRLYTYDANNNMLSYTLEVWESGAWKGSARTLYTYDANNHVLTETYQNFISGVWENFSRHSYTYDVTGNLLIDTYEIAQATVFNNNSRHVYTYNAANKLLSDLVEIWDAGVWKLNDRKTYTYNADNNRLSLVEEAYNSGNWSTEYSYKYSYDTDGYWQGKDTYYSADTSTGPIIASRFYYDTLTTVGLNEIAKISTKTYPNPTVSNALLEFEVMEDGKVNFSLLDVNGRQLAHTEQYYPAGKHNLLIDLSAYTSGVYLYKMNDSKGNVGNGKVLKQ